MNRKLFDYKNLGHTKELSEKGDEKWISKFLLTHFEKVSKLEEDLMRLPTPEEFIFLQTDNSFNAFTFIPMICKVFSVKELYASTYSISRKAIEALVELHDSGCIEQVTLMISDSMIKRNPVTIDNLMSMANSRANFTVNYAWSHAKVCLLKTEDAHYVIEGSGNWAENAHYEQYLFANSKGLYEFREKLFTEAKLR
jgi:hypothetical protein